MRVQPQLAHTTHETISKTIDDLICRGRISTVDDHGSGPYGACFNVEVSTSVASAHTRPIRLNVTTFAEEVRQTGMRPDTEDRFEDRTGHDSPIR